MKPMFNKAIYFNPLKNLHWKGFKTGRDFASLDYLIDDLANLHPNYQNIPFFRNAYKQLSQLPAENLKKLQKEFLDAINHDYHATILPSFIPEQEMSKLKAQAELIFQAAVLFAKDLAIHEGRVEEVRNFFAEKYISELETFDKVMDTSLYNYANYATKSEAKRYANRATDPLLYSECGIDFMYGEKGWTFAELQFSYQSYPQNLESLFCGLKKVIPRLMSSSFESSYPKRRTALIKRFIQKISKDQKALPLVIDAWTETEHPTRNYTELASQIAAQYLLFDDFTKDKKGLKYSEITKDAKKIFIFNQALLYFLEPNYFFEPILHERLEEYDFLELRGIYDDYMSGKAYLANPPIIDILNDKAIYCLLPYLVEYYLDQKLDIAVSNPIPIWDSPLLCNSAIIEDLLNHKDKWVLCHRYLEGGDGVRVGLYLEQNAWKEFIETYVREKPYLFICRKYFPMNPDTSFRIYCSGLLEDKDMIVESSNELLGRINPTGLLIEKSHFFLCQPL